MEKRNPVILVVIYIFLISYVQCEDGLYATLSLKILWNPITIKNHIVVQLRVEGRDSKMKDIDDLKLQCYQSKTNSTSTNGAVIKYSPKYDKKIRAMATRVIFQYKVKPRREGYFWCEYANFTQEETVYSDVVYFFDKNKHVSVAKLSRSIDIKDLQNIMDNAKIRVLKISSKNRVFHFILDNSTTNEGSLKKVQNLLTTKSLKFEYVRSTVVCPQNEEYNLPSTELPFNISLATHNEKYCDGDFYTGAYWNEAKLQKREEIPRLQHLMNINDSVLESQDIIQQFSNKLENLSSLEPTDVKIVANKFNLLLSAEKDVFKEDKQNISKGLLAKLESLLGNISLVSGGEKVQVELENFAVLVEDIKKTGTTGVLVSDIASIGRSNRFKMDSLNQSLGVGDIQNSLTRVGILFPTSLLANSSTPENLAITVFRDAGPLFDSRNDTSSIISATLGGEHFDNLQEPVVLFFMRNISSYPEPGECVFWDFQAKNGTGAWSSEGCNYSSSRKLNDDAYLDVCQCNHLTYFAAIFSRGTSNIDKQNEQNLKLISLVGCSVSLVSLCGVFINAIFSKKWLRGPGQKILLQMAINLAMLLIMFLVTAYLKGPGIGCVVIGFFFHYTILSNFFWMAVAGYLQYYRLVKVLSSRTSKLVLKTTIIGWGLPIIPGVVVLSAGKYNSGAPLCLPVDGWAFYATILAPICLVLVFNIGIFTMIFKNLYMTTKPRQHVDRCISLRRFKQLAFLFTLLGLNWIFGVCHYVFSESTLVFAYLFSVMLTFQGLTYFVFFVLHERARNFWKTIIKCCLKTKGDHLNELTMDTAISTISQSN